MKRHFSGQPPSHPSLLFVYQPNIAKQPFILLCNFFNRTMPVTVEEFAVPVLMYLEFSRCSVWRPMEILHYRSSSLLLLLYHCIYYLNRNY